VRDIDLLGTLKADY
jgi:hypothetical protein